MKSYATLVYEYCDYSYIGRLAGLKDEYKRARWDKIKVKRTGLTNDSHWGY